MDLQSQFPDITQKLVGLMKDTFASRIKTYYDGTPEYVADNCVPCIIVDATNTRIGLGGTGEDAVNDSITIDLVMDGRLSEDEDPETDMAKRRLRSMVMAIDPTTGSWYEGTILYALRNNIDLAGFIDNADITIEFNQFATKRQDMPWLVTASITLNINRRVLIGYRMPDTNL